MENLALLAICFLLGILLRRTGRFSDTAPAALNAFVINIALPALALLHIHNLQFTGAHLVAVLMPWVIFGLSVIFFHVIGTRMGLSRRTIGCLMLVGGLGNTSRPRWRR
jgi:predicted permease